MVACADCGLPTTNERAPEHQQLVDVMKSNLPTVASVNVHRDYVSRIQREKNLALFNSKLDELDFLGRPRALAVQGTWIEASESTTHSMRRFDFGPTSAIAFHVHHTVVLSNREATKLAGQIRDFWVLLFQHGFVAEGDGFLPFLRGKERKPFEEALFLFCVEGGGGWEKLLKMNRDKSNKNEFISALNALRAGLPLRALVHIMSDNEGSYKLLDSFLKYHHDRITLEQELACRSAWRELFMVHIKNAQRPPHDRFLLFKRFFEEIGPAQCGWRDGVPEI